MVTSFPVCRPTPVREISSPMVRCFSTLSLIFKFFFNDNQSIDNSLKVFKMNITLIKIVMIKSWRTLQGFVVLDISRNPGLRLNLYIIADRDMSRNIYLATNHTVLAHFGRTCNSRLRCDNGILSDDHIMGNLNLIIQFHALFYNRGPQSCTVYRGARANIYIVFENHVACLWNFMVFSMFIGSESKSIRPNYYPTVDDTVFSHNRFRIKLSTRKQNSVISNLNVIPYIDIGIYFHIIADNNIFS